MEFDAFCVLLCARPNSLTKSDPQLMSALPFPILTTPRLRLRPLEEADASLMYQLRTDPIVNQFVERPAPKDLPEAQDFIEYLLKEIAEQRILYWCMILEETGASIGTICFWNFSEDRKTAEVGYDLLPDYHQKGLMGEALAAVLTFGFESLALQMITAFTDKENVPSRKLLERFGFELNLSQKDHKFPNNVVYNLPNDR
jgi:ribosomal-protein-alanine N-acetyltransferase